MSIEKYMNYQKQDPVIKQFDEIQKNLDDAKMMYTAILEMNSKMMEGIKAFQMASTGKVRQTEDDRKKIYANYTQQDAQEVDEIQKKLAKRRGELP